MKRNRNDQSVKQSGMTLIELLVVATIIMMVTAVSIPALKPMLKSQATSNAASAVVTYLNKARSRAMLTGRPCGVFFELWSGTEGWYEIEVNGVAHTASYGACLVMRQMEIPPIYTGVTEDATVSIENIGGNWSVDTSNDPYWDSFVSPNSRIQLNEIGPWFHWDPAFGEIPPRYQTDSSFKAMLDPRPTMTAPVGLPQGTVVDLQYSGVDDVRLQVLNADAYSQLDALSAAPVRTGNRYASRGMFIMFLPNGEVDYIRGMYRDDPSGTHRCNADDYFPEGNIYLLIGHWDRIRAIDAGDDISNLNDANNFWVVINPRTGLITTAEVNPIIRSNKLQDMLIESREFARITKKNTGDK